MEWIKCSERLPEPKYIQEQVIISCLDKLVIAGWYDKEISAFKDEHNGCVIFAVTHWMPLPPPPTD